MSEDILQSTMGGLDAGLHVLHIATLNSQCCALSGTVEAVRADERFRGFDHVPVVNEAGRVVGVLAPGDAAHGAVGEAMQPLDDTMLVSAEEPLARFLPTLADGPYRLVVCGTRIGGIVTRSDVLKLPVRLLAFTLVTHLEMTMASLIRAKHPSNDNWIDLVEPHRQKKVLGKFKYLQKHKLDPSLLECTDFQDKRVVIAQLYALDDTFLTETEHVEGLRNTIAHAADYGQTEAELQDFLVGLQQAEHWTLMLNQSLAAVQGSAKL